MKSQEQSRLNVEIRKSKQKSWNLRTLGNLGCCVGRYSWFWTRTKHILVHMIVSRAPSTALCIALGSVGSGNR